MLARHLLAILALPFLVTVVVPGWIATRYGVSLGVASSAGGILLQATGGIVLGIGLALVVATVRLFATAGHGTLAPWDPPTTLVVRGPYRHVRNPMISGVILLLCAEALLLRSWPHAAWAGLFAGANAVYIPLSEEPGLERRFGEAYREYRRHVPRFLPRLRPWGGDGAPPR